jgi:hypothetical protein
MANDDLVEREHPPLVSNLIAVTLTAEGIPISGRGRKSARGWTQETVRYILTNSAYIGEFRYKDVVVNLPHLAIIDRTV